MVRRTRVVRRCAPAPSGANVRRSWWGKRPGCSHVRVKSTPAAAPEPTSPSRADGAVACFLALLFAALFGLSLQERLWGDGRDVLNLLTWDERAWWRSWPHVLHTHVALLFGALGPFERVHDDFALASAVPAGVAVGALYFASRLLGAARLAAAFAAVLAGGAPVVCFFATMLEVHTLHFGVVSVALLASLWCGARWSGARFHAAHGALFLVVALSHLTSATLVPIWALLGWFARGRRGARRELRDDLGAIGVDLVIAGAGFAAALTLSQLLHYEEASSSAVSDIGTMILGSLGALGPRYFLDEWIAPLGVAALFGPWACSVLVVPALRRALGEGTRDWLVVTVLGGLPVFAFFTLWAFDNEGGYALGILPFLVVAGALLATRFVRNRAALFIGGALVVLQAFLGHAALVSWRADLALAGTVQRRTAFVALLHGGERVIAIDIGGQPLDWYVPRVVERDFVRVARGLDDDAMRAAVRAEIESLAADRATPIYIDYAYRYWNVPGTPAAELIEMFETELLRVFDFERVTDAGWPIARLVPRAVSDS